MTQAVTVSQHDYKAIKKLSSGSSITIPVKRHMVPGKCEVVAPGGKPIACRIKHEDENAVITRA